MRAIAPAIMWIDYVKNITYYNVHTSRTTERVSLWVVCMYYVVNRHKPVNYRIRHAGCGCEVERKKYMTMVSYLSNYCYIQKDGICGVTV